MVHTPYTLPYMKGTLLCNGVPIAESPMVLPAHGGYQIFAMNVLGNGRYKSTATQITVRFQDVQWIYPNELAAGTAMCDIDALPVGNWTPFMVRLGEWPQAPCGILHWLKAVPVYAPGEEWGKNPPKSYETFSLLLQQEQTRLETGA